MRASRGPRADPTADVLTAKDLCSTAAVGAALVLAGSRYGSPSFVSLGGEFGGFRGAGVNFKWRRTFSYNKLGPSLLEPKLCAWPRGRRGRAVLGC